MEKLDSVCMLLIAIGEALKNLDKTTGLEDLDVPLKMERLKQWGVDINKAQSEIKYDYVFVDEESFDKFKPKSFEGLIRNFTKYKAYSI